MKKQPSRPDSRDDGGLSPNPIPMEIWELPLYYDVARAAGFQGTEAEAYEALGERLRFLGRSGDALVAFRRAAELDPTNSLCWFRIGQLYLDRQHYEQAAEALAASAALLPDHWVTQLSHGKALAGFGKHVLAIEAFTRAAELNPKSAAPLVQRAQCHEALGHLDAAISDLEAALRLQPEGKRHRQLVGHLS
jgi:tetratricopeptide (TPR) repeat protein